MDCPIHKIKAVFINSSSYALMYECPKGHSFEIIIDDIENEEERRIVKLLSCPITRGVLEFIMEKSRTTKEIEDNFINIKYK